MIIVAMIGTEVNGQLVHDYMLNYVALNECENYFKVKPGINIRFYPNDKRVNWDDVRFFDANWSEAMTIEELREYYEG